MDMEWEKLGFSYRPTDYRYVSNYKDGAWDEGTLSDDPNVTLSEAACVLQYAQCCFEGLKAYRRPDGQVQLFRPWENIARLMQRKHYYFVPYGQDDAAQKPQSLKADLTLLPAALEAALHGQQLQPVLREWN